MEVSLDTAELDAEKSQLGMWNDKNLQNRHK